MSFDTFRQKELEGWDSRAEGYATATARATTQAIPALLAGARCRVGLKILDLCTGPGFAAGAASAIGADVEGLDFAPAMVVEAARRFPRIPFREGDALDLPDSDASFDAVICNSGVFHFTDPTLAFAEAARVLRSGGRFAFSQWHTPAPGTVFGIIFGAIKAHADMAVVPPAPDAFAYSAPRVTAAALEDAGFGQIEIIEVPSVYFGETATFWEDFLRLSVRTPIVLESQTPEVRAAIRTDVLKAVSEFDRDGQFEIPMPSMVYASQKR
jgi:ubiquinone/menaquinone biosynthesis C-methylase UbiE